MRIRRMRQAALATGWPPAMYSGQEDSKAPLPMQLTLRGDYAVRVAVDLASQSPDVRVKTGDLGATWIWDTRCVLHPGRRRDAARYPRVMRRTTVAGDRPTADPPLPARTAAWEDIVPEEIGAA